MSDLTAQQIINSALRVIGALASGDDPSSDESNDCLEALNDLVASWSADGLKVNATTKESFNLAASTASYTIGSGATVNTVRPKKIISAFIRDSSNIDHWLRIITEEQYRMITDKTTTSRPTRLFYDPSYSTGTIYVYPTPDTVEACHIESLKTFTEFATLATDVALPGEYKRALKFNLAIDIAPEFGVTVGGAIGARAEETLNTIIGLNLSNQLTPAKIDPGLPGMGGRYNINSDT